MDKPGLVPPSNGRTDKFILSDRYFYRKIAGKYWKNTSLVPPSNGRTGSLFGLPAMLFLRNADKAFYVEMSIRFLPQLRLYFQRMFYPIFRNLQWIQNLSIFYRIGVDSESPNSLKSIASWIDNKLKYAFFNKESLYREDIPKIDSRITIMSTINSGMLESRDIPKNLHFYRVLGKELISNGSEFMPVNEASVYWQNGLFASVINKSVSFLGSLGINRGLQYFAGNKYLENEQLSVPIVSGKGVISNLDQIGNRDIISLAGTDQGIGKTLIVSKNISLFQHLLFFMSGKTSFHRVGMEPQAIHEHNQYMILQNTNIGDAKKKPQFVEVKAIHIVKSEKPNVYESNNQVFYFREQDKINREIEDIKKLITHTKKPIEEQNDLSRLSHEQSNFQNVDDLSEKVYRLIERKIVIEKERKGLI